MLVGDRELAERAARIETLIEDIASFPDPEVREKAVEVVQGLLLLYGEGLARILATIEERADQAERARIFDAFAEDELISHLLCLHDLHPVDVETRVIRALQEVRPYLESHGGNVELLGVEDGVAKLRLQGSCSGCPSSTVTLKLAIEEAILRAAPELEGIEAEGVAEPAPRPMNFLPASDVLLLKQRQVSSASTWVEVASAAELACQEMRALDVSGMSLLFVKARDALYAYRNACPGCGRQIERGVLRGSELSCPACGRRYDVCRAGRSLDGSDQRLEPVPLLVRDDRVTVALGSA